MLNIAELRRQIRPYSGVSLIVLAIAALLLFREKDAPAVLVPKTVRVLSESDILPVDDSLVAPVIYDSVHFLDELPHDIRKQKFIEVLLPAILIVQHKVDLQRRRLDQIADRWGQQEVEAEDSAFVLDLLAVYKAETLEDLLRCLCIQPPSIALAQAALESGWGTSRVFKLANNVFGIWSFDQEEERIRASASSEERSVYLRKYESILQSVEDYFRVLSTGHAYEEYRLKRCETQNVYDLIWYLRNYSEMRNQYVVMLRNMIAANDLTRYDRYRLSPEYFHRVPLLERGVYLR
jgi:Bax protein